MKQILLTLLLANSIYANQNKVGAIFTGSHTLLNNNYYQYCYNRLEYEYFVTKTGLNFGVLLPIKITKLNFDYKIKISHHNVSGFKQAERIAVNWYGCQGGFDKFSSGLNEILIGKALTFNKNIIIPQIGFGFIVESLWSDRQSGRIYSLFFYDYSIQYKYNLDYYSFGVIINFENGFYAGYSSFEPLNRFNISILIAK